MNTSVSSQTKTVRWAALIMKANAEAKMEVTLKPP